MNSRLVVINRPIGSGPPPRGGGGGAARRCVPELARISLGRSRRYSGPRRRGSSRWTSSSDCGSRWCLPVPVGGRSRFWGYPAPGGVVRVSGRARPSLIAAAEDRQKEQEDVEYVEEDRRREQRCGADVLAAAQPLEVEGCEARRRWQGRRSRRRGMPRESGRRSRRRRREPARPAREKEVAGERERNEIGASLKITAAVRNPAGTTPLPRRLATKPAGRPPRSRRSWGRPRIPGEPRTRKAGSGRGVRICVSRDRCRAA